MRSFRAVRYAIQTRIHTHLSEIISPIISRRRLPREVCPASIFSRLLSHRVTTPISASARTAPLCSQRPEAIPAPWSILRTERILTEIKGRMLEDIVLLETKLANPKKQVFVLQFPVGEFDMVVFDPEAGSCRIFEIKHSEEAVPQQYRHLIDEQKCAQTEHRYGPIDRKVRPLPRGKPSG